MGTRTADHPIAARRRLRDDQELDIRRGVVAHLVRGAGRYLDALVRAQCVARPVDLHRRCAREDEEELSRHLVVVPYLGGARWHALVDDAQFGAVDQPPAVTSLAPGVVLSGI